MKIFVTAKPSAGKEEIKRIDDTHYIVSVKEPPVKGRANFAIVKALTEYFDLPKSNVKIVSGHTSRQKSIEINC